MPWPLILFLLALAGLVDNSKLFPVRSDAPRGWLIADLLHEGIASPGERLRLANGGTNQLGQHFAVNASSAQLLVNGPLDRFPSLDKALGSRLFLVEVEASRQPALRRILTLQVQVQSASSPALAHFSSPLFFATVDANNSSPGTELNFTSKSDSSDGRLEAIRVVEGQQNQAAVGEWVFEPVSREWAAASDLLAIWVHTGQAKIQLLRRPRPEERQLELWLGARLANSDGGQPRRVPPARLQIRFRHPPPPASPRFEQQRVQLRLRAPVPAHKTLVRVSARVSRGTPIYRIEPESVPFDVAPLFGDVFPKSRLWAGRYTFRVVAMDSSAQEGECWVDLLVEGGQQEPSRDAEEGQQQQQQKKMAAFPPADKDQPFGRRFGLLASGGAGRRRRDRGHDLVLSLPEDRPLGPLEQKISLHGDERVSKLGAESSTLRVLEDGRLELIGPLNFEREPELLMTVQIEGTHKTRLQTIRVQVLDVDEPPAFLNEPRPLLAVVPPSDGLPLGFQVFRLEARDERGEASAEKPITYRLINSEPAGAFTVDPESGAIRTGWRKYSAGSTFRVFVEAMDQAKLGGDVGGRQRQEEAEVAVVEILAGDRPPQFLLQKYSTTVPESLAIGHGVLQLEAKGFPPVEEDGPPKGPISFALYMEQPAGGGDSASGAGREPSPHFGVDQHSGLVNLRRPLDFDDRAQPRFFRLVGVATEAGRQSTVPVEVWLQDVNDNAPQFVQPLYTASVREDLQLGETILTVEAMDPDSGLNSAIVYAVDHPQFMVTARGELQRRPGTEPLDADQLRQGHFLYRFNVTASDRGDPPLQAHALVHVRTENVNDEAPQFVPTAEYAASVAEDALGGTPVLQVQAIDPDRDQVSYAFIDPEEGEEMLADPLFQIDLDTGLIRLRLDVSPERLLAIQSPYNLTVLARDDGSCCPKQNQLRHSARALVRVSVSDVNNNKPEFPHCADYSRLARIEEGQYRANATPILRAEAIDQDSGRNGQIVYSLYYARSESRKPFLIDPETGELRPSPYFLFDREAKAAEEVTIKATDRGDRPLIGFCQFTVQIDDVNDNAPAFDRPLYEVSMGRATRAGTIVLTVLAEDRDAPRNARVTYSLAPDETAAPEHREDHRLFKLADPELGEIAWASQRMPSGRDRFQFSVLASDNGFPEAQTTAAQVVVKVHEKQQNAPQWQAFPECPSRLNVPEDLQKNSILLRCYAISGEDRSRPISYKLSNGVHQGRNGKPTFREFEEKEPRSDVSWVLVRNMEALDFEQSRNFSLVLTATDMISSASSERHFHIEVEDRNDEVPRFTVDRFIGTVDEELSPAEFQDRSGGQPVTVVRAEDGDAPGTKHSEIRYRILDTPSMAASRLFRIDEISGAIFPLDKFDREQNDSFIFDVEARDSAPSSLPGTKRGAPNRDLVKVQIFVADANDNAPRFPHPFYTVQVPENVELGKELMTVRAEDPDSHSTLRYWLYSPRGERIPFGVRTDSGQIYVKDGLDFERRQQFELELLVSDGRHNVTTGVRVLVTDENDNAPEFDRPSYEATVDEGPQAKLPLALFRVRATDRDKEETNGRILFSLEGQGVGQHFRIDRHSGQVELISPLDRDPPEGVADWRFMVQATDRDGQGLVGYADVHVQVRDVNDNGPVFPGEMLGWIDEDREPEAFVLRAEATDRDDPQTGNAQLEYSLVRNKELNGQPIFRIEPDTGKIFATVRLDREQLVERHFRIQVRAVDRGLPQREGLGNVTIQVRDVNDNPPAFPSAEYSVTVPETTPRDAPVLSLLAMDPDDEAIDNQFTYSLLDSDEHFYITSEANSNDGGNGGRRVGVIRVKKASLPMYYRLVSSNRVY